jgi:hypothetical protein
MSQPSVDNALAPIEFILSVAGTLMLLVLLLFVPATVFGNASFLGLGDPEVCVSAPTNAMHYNSGGQMREQGGQSPGTRVRSTHVELCDGSPTASQRFWSVVSTLPDFLYAFGFVGLAWRLTRTARRRGLFSPDVALGVGHLGLYVLMGAVAVALTRMGADMRLFASMTDTASSASWLLFFHLSWVILFAGFGLLTVGRVMAQSVRMQRVIDATV